VWNRRTVPHGRSSGFQGSTEWLEPWVRRVSNDGGTLRAAGRGVGAGPKAFAKRPGAPWAEKTFCEPSVETNRMSFYFRERHTASNIDAPGVHLVPRRTRVDRRRHDRAPVRPARARGGRKPESVPFIRGIGAVDRARLAVDRRCALTYNATDRCPSRPGLARYAGSIQPRRWSSPPSQPAIEAPLGGH
jgi:hypothetical protein